MNLHLEKEIGLMAVLQAGGEIMKIHDAQKFHVQEKEGGSPVTEADFAANEIILSYLLQHFPSDSVLTEEESELTHRFPDRANARRVWILDPIDGTKEFVDGNGEFAVSLALAIDGIPALGIVHSPFDNFYIVAGSGIPLETNQPGNKLIGPVDICVSRSETRRGHFPDFENGFPGGTVRRVGSIANKLGRLAAGQCNLVISRENKNEWDIAGGHAVVLYSGLGFSDLHGNPIAYNKSNTVSFGVVAGRSDLQKLFLKI